MSENDWHILYNAVSDKWLTFNIETHKYLWGDLDDARSYQTKMWFALDGVIEICYKHGVIQSSDVFNKALLLFHVYEQDGYSYVEFDSGKHLNMFPEFRKLLDL